MSHNLFTVVTSQITDHHNIYNDETDGHVDNICASIRPGEVVLGWTDDETDPQYALSCEDLKVLETETDAKGRVFKVHKLPIPKNHVFIGEEDLKGYEFEEGEEHLELTRDRFCFACATSLRHSDLEILKKSDFDDPDNPSSFSFVILLVRES